jgi:pyruvate formate lyase activating enzyme
LKPLFLKYDNYIECTLCPHLCKIAYGKRGICGVRKNTGDKIELLTYGVISGHSLDPVEKKPLYHFFPGYNILSIGSYGCNMRCDFCQNYQISQRSAESFSPDMDPDKLAIEALKATKNIGLAFTYNEPVVWFEFIMDTAIKIKERGMYTVMVSNGFINRSPLNDLLKFIDAFNIDLKAFNDSFYKKLTGAKLQPVKESLKQILKAGKHLEITTLIIPGMNDSEKEMEMEAQWISEELGNEIPLHLSRYFPIYKRDDPVTPELTLTRLFDIASKYLKYVYVGNMSAGRGQDTYCSKCGRIVTKRSGYSTSILNLDREGKCSACGNLVYKNFNFSSRAKN